MNWRGCIYSDWKLVVFTRMSCQFPSDILHIITNYAALWTIVPWVRAIEDTINASDEWPSETQRCEMKAYGLCYNPMAMDEIINYKISPAALANNPADWAFDIIEPNIEYYEMGVSNFPHNSNPRAIAYIERNIDALTSMYWNVLLMNPGAVELIKKYDGITKASQPDLIYYNNNEAVWDLIKDHYMTIDINNIQDALSHNSSSWAQRILIENNIEPHITGISSIHDPKIFDMRMSKYAHLKEDWWTHFDELSLDNLYANPAAIHIIRKYPGKITNSIWENPAIFELTMQSGMLDILTEFSW